MQKNVKANQLATDSIEGLDKSPSLSSPSISTSEFAVNIVPSDVEASSSIPPSSSTPSEPSTSPRSPSPPQSFVFKSSKYTPTGVQVHRTRHRPTLSTDLLSRHAGQAIDIGWRHHQNRYTGSSPGGDSFELLSSPDASPSQSPIASTSASPNIAMTPSHIFSTSSPILAPSAPAAGPTPNATSPTLSPSPSIASISSLSLHSTPASACTSSSTLFASPSPPSKPSKDASSPSSKLYMRRRHAAQDQRHPQQYALSLSEIIQAPNTKYYAPLPGGKGNTASRISPKVAKKNSPAPQKAPASGNHDAAVPRAADGTKKVADDEDDYFCPKAYVTPPTDLIFKNSQKTSKSRLQKTKNVKAGAKGSRVKGFASIPSNAPFDAVVAAKAFIDPVAAELLPTAIVPPSPAPPTPSPVA